MSDAEQQQQPVAPPAEEEVQSSLRQHSNDNLTKIDTHDKFSTCQALKKYIIKMLGKKIDPAASPLFKGMQRMNKNPKTQFVFMAFETPEDQKAAVELLEQVTFRGTPWKSVEVREADLAVTHKGGNKRPRSGGAEDSSKLTQYEKYPLERQLELKKQHCLKVMRQIVPSRPHGWEAYAKRFLGIVESPLLRGYRNHVSLSFGETAAGEPSLGFMTGAFVDGHGTIESAVEEGKDIVTMNAVSKAVAVATMDVYRAMAGHGLTVFDKGPATGFWRKLQVRHNVHGEVMVDAEVDEDSVPAETFAAWRRYFVETLTSEETAEKLRAATGMATAKVVSVQYHKHTGISSVRDELPRVVLAGAGTLTETLAGLEYELSPTAFFQVNTPGMERMLERVQSVAELSPTTTLLDLCSGTGTIGLTLARHVKRVIGIEVVESAVENAKRNAERNGITNASFLCGRVEHLLPQVISGLAPEDRADIVAILDPPRVGVNTTVLKWIRGTATIRRVVYISCEQKALERDCPALTKPATKAYWGTPFEVTSGFAVDLFPHTHHVEMVAVLNRVADEEEAAPVAGAVETEEAEPAVEDEESAADGDVAAESANCTGGME